MKYSYIIIASLFIIISCNNHRVENVEVNIKVKNENQCKVIIPDKGCSFAQAFDTKKYEEIIGNKDFNQLVFRVLKIVNFKENFSLKATNVHLAAALITNENGVKRRMIIYNPNLFYKENLRKGRFVINTIVAHEVAHHLLGHTLTEEGSRPSIELEADRFAGFVSYALGSTLIEAQKAVLIYASMKSTKTHPARNARLIAIENGYMEAKKHKAWNSYTYVAENTTPSSSFSNRNHYFKYQISNAPIFAISIRNRKLRDDERIIVNKKKGEEFELIEAKTLIGTLLRQSPINIIKEEADYYFIEAMIMGDLKKGYIQKYEYGKSSVDTLR